MNALAKTYDQTHAWQLNHGCYAQLRGGCWIRATGSPTNRSLPVVFVKPEMVGKPGMTALHGKIHDTTLDAGLSLPRISTAVT
jgi:hypothetical protein